jgi:hypothetical protein
MAVAYNPSAYNPKLATILVNGMQDMQKGLGVGLDGQPNITPAS